MFRQKLGFFPNISSYLKFLDSFQYAMQAEQSLDVINRFSLILNHMVWLE